MMKFALQVSGREMTFSEEELVAILEKHFDIEATKQEEKDAQTLEAGFSDDQMEQIRLGLKYFTAEAIEVYAKPEFNAKQMEQIRLGLETFLDAEEIELYAKPEYDAELMEEMRLVLEDGLTVKGFEMLYAKPNKYNYEQRTQILIGFLQDGLSVETLEDLYAKPEFNAEQMDQIRLGLKQYLTIPKIKSYAKPEYSAKQMNQIRTDMVIHWIEYDEYGNHIPSTRWL